MGLSVRDLCGYDWGLGWVTQPDPIGLAGGLNLYGYANGDPINFSDPFGLCAESEGDTTSTASSCSAPPPDDDPCKAYPAGSLLGGICSRTAPAEAEVGDVTGRSCTADCLANYYLQYAGSPARPLSGAQMIDYLFKGHAQCYEGCGYTLKDFASDFTFGTGTRMRARAAPSVPASVRPDQTRVVRY